MVRVTWHHRLYSIFLSIFYLLILTGCPGPGDRIRFDETAWVSREGDNVCMSIADAQDYQPVDMGINPRGTFSKEKKFDFSPGLSIANGKLCIPPSYYIFPDKGQFIIEYVLKSKMHEDYPRSFVVTLESYNGRVYNVTPTEKEIYLPYCRDKGNKSSGFVITGACQQ